MGLQGITSTGVAIVQPGELDGSAYLGVHKVCFLTAVQTPGDSGTTCGVNNNPTGWSVNAGVNYPSVTDHFCAAVCVD